MKEVFCNFSETAQCGDHNINVIFDASTHRNGDISMQTNMIQEILPSLNQSSRCYDKEAIKQQAAGWEVEILESVAGISDDLLDGKHHPCPKCGGDDRFRLLDANAGAVFCNQWFKENNGDFISAVMHYREVDFPEALRLIAEYLGIKPLPQPKRPHRAVPQNQPAKQLVPDQVPNQDAIADWCQNHKPGTGPDGVIRCNAKTGLYAGAPSLVLPMFGSDLERVTGGAVYHLDGTEIDSKKVINASGSKSGIIGTIEVLRQLTKESIVYRVEGPTDAIALADVIPEDKRSTVAVFANACGANENPDKSPYKELLERIVAVGCKLVIIGDNDEPGQSGVKKWGEYAAQQGCDTWSVTLPETVFDAPVNDVRDYLLTGGLFDDLNGLAKPFVAEQAEQTEPDKTVLVDAEHVDDQTVTLSKPIVCNPMLKSLLGLIKPIDFGLVVQEKGDGKMSQKKYQVITISQIIKIAQENNWGLAVNNGFVYLFNGSFWESLDIGEFKAFLASAAILIGVPELDARHHTFRDELYKQFVSDGNLPPPQESNVTLINLMNGTFEISDTELNLRPPQTSDFLKHQLPFEYQLEATAPMFEAFLNRVLPEPELQMILAEYIGYVFVVGLKLEKVLILHGTGANGKSVIFDTIYALLGYENVSCYKLATLTRISSYERAELQNKLLNYASELNGNLEADTFKQLASGEPIEARRIYGHPFLMRRYAKLMFNCNELPREVENTHAFFRRFLIIPFQQTIPEDEQDPQLAQKIIASELPGVFNWVLGGLKRLIHNRKFTESDIVREQVEEYQRESDSVAMFIDESCYQRSTSKFMSFKVFYSEYKEFCHSDGYRAVGKKNFTKRCKVLGLEKEKKREHVIYVEKVFDTTPVQVPHPSQCPDPEPDSSRCWDADEVVPF